jgi:hypothetical protein
MERHSDEGSADEHAPSWLGPVRPEEVPGAVTNLQCLVYVCLALAGMYIVGYGATFMMGGPR